MRYEIDEKTEQDIENRFTYHAPQGDQVNRYGFIRRVIRDAALSICERVPPGRERALALTKLQEASMWANAGIACGEEPLTSGEDIFAEEG
jgi:hypothetical protein